jgi:hypothetical protein
MSRRRPERPHVSRYLADGELPDFARDWADYLFRQTASVLRGFQPVDATITAALNLRVGQKLDPVHFSPACSPNSNRLSSSPT